MALTNFHILSESAKLLCSFDNDYHYRENEVVEGEEEEDEEVVEEEGENDNEEIELRTQPMLEDKDSENPITNVESNAFFAPQELDKRLHYENKCI